MAHRSTAHQKRVRPPTGRLLAPTMANWRCLDASESLFDVARCPDRRSSDIEGIARGDPLVIRRPGLSAANTGQAVPDLCRITIGGQP